jgi:hypothetical protein
MTARGRQAVQSAERLRQVLERTAGALATADLDALLRSEMELAQAIENVTPPRTLTPDERAAMRTEVEGVQQALARCQQLAAGRRADRPSTVCRHGA